MKRTGRLLAWMIMLGAICGAIAIAQAPPEPPAAPPAPPPPPAAPAAAPGPAAPMVEKVTLTCDGKVKTDGTVTFVFTPAGGAASEIGITLQKGMDKQDVCRDLAKELGVKLGADYKVQGEGGQVKVLGAKKDVKFSLALGGQTATGATIAIKVR